MLIFEKIEIFTCFFMTGVIWIVQLVHYPSFFFVAKEKFKEFETFHQKNISFVVLPNMCLELFSNFILLFYYQIHTGILNYLASLALVLIWSVTFFICMPCHLRLSSGFEENQAKRLTFANWLRTFLWSFRSLYLLSTF